MLRKLFARIMFNCFGLVKCFRCGKYEKATKGQFKQYGKCGIFLCARCSKDIRKAFKGGK